MIFLAILIAVCIIYIQIRIEAHTEPLKGFCVYSQIKGMIGARINKNGIVSCVRYRSPAQTAGLRAGDRIVKVDMQKFALQQIHGCAGDSVRLTVVRDEALIDLEIPYVDEHTIDYKTDPDRYFDEMGGWDDWQPEHYNA